MSRRESGVRFSDDRDLRYSSWRVWSPEQPLCTFVMLNPPTADETTDDPTFVRHSKRSLG